MTGTFEEVALRAYSDRALTPGTRELVLAIAYGAFLDPEGGPRNAVSRAARHLGRDRIGDKRIRRLIHEDLPRYEPPESARPLGSALAPSCMGPRIRPYIPRRRRPVDDGTTRLHKRPGPTAYVNTAHPPPREDFRNRDNVCGAPGRSRVIEADPRTGWWTAHWYCDRHKGEAERVRAQLAPINESAPEPIPNRGGRLPTYFKGEWEAVYRYYAPHWKPPVYGIRADEWPTPETASAGGGVRRPRLRVVK